MKQVPHWILGQQNTMSPFKNNTEELLKWAQVDAMQMSLNFRFLHRPFSL